MPRIKERTEAIQERDSRRRPDQGIVLLGFGSALPKSAQCVPRAKFAAEQFHARIAPNNAMTLSRMDWL